MKFIDMNGMKLPALGFGTWELRGGECLRGVARALEIGYRHIDTAQIYENEGQVGEALSNSGVARAELFVTTKIWTTNFKRPLVFSSVEESLSKLRMDYVDLLLIHWPNPQVALEETLSALQQLLEQGKTKAIGISNFPVTLMHEAVEICNAPIVCNQVEYHALLSQKPVLEYAKVHNMVVTAYSPLARGKLAKHPLLMDIGKKYGKTGSQVALRWLIEQEGVAAIPKAASAENAQANFAIFDFALDNKDRAAIASINTNQRLINPSFAPRWDAA